MCGRGIVTRFALGNDGCGGRWRVEHQILNGDAAPLIGAGAYGVVIRDGVPGDRRIRKQRDAVSRGFPRRRNEMDVGKINVPQ